MKKNTIVFFVIATILVVALVLTFVLRAQSDGPVIDPVVGNGTIDNNEIFESDIFKDYNRFENKTDFDSRDITVLGVKLGNSKSTVLSRLGQPDDIQDFSELGINYLYGTRFGLNMTDALILHFDNEILTRWTVFYDLNDKLKGKTKIDKREDALYRAYGLPDKIFQQNSFKKLMYNEGFDLGLNDVSKQISLSFVTPDVQKTLTVQEYKIVKKNIPFENKNENITE